MMQRVFRGKLSTSDDIVLKYKDEGSLLFGGDSLSLLFNSDDSLAHSLL